MTYTLLFIAVVLIGFAYSIKYGNKAKKDIAKFNEHKQKSETFTQEIVDLKYFGEIDLNKTEEYTDVLANLNGQEISIDLNIIEKRISKKTIEPTIDFLNNLLETEKIASKKVLSDFGNGNVVKDYIEHHLKEFNDNELNSLGIDITKSNEDKIKLFLSKIHLKRIGLYPEEWDNMAIFDYTINDDLTQYLIVLSFNSEGEFIDIYTES